MHKQTTSFLPDYVNDRAEPGFDAELGFVSPDSTKLGAQMNLNFEIYETASYSHPIKGIWIYGIQSV